MSAFRAARLVSIAAVALSSMTAGANEFPPAPDPGTVFIFTQGRVERFVSADADTQIWATRRGREYTRNASPAQPILKWQVGERSGERKVVGNADALWPPVPGNRARFRVLSISVHAGRKRRSVELWRCDVEKVVSMTVQAGVYDVLPIICLRYSANTMRPLQKRTWWWSDDVGHYVRRRYENLRNGDTTDVRLCAALPDDRATPARIAAIVNGDC